MPQAAQGTSSAASELFALIVNMKSNDGYTTRDDSFDNNCSWVDKCTMTRIKLPRVCLERGELHFVRVLTFDYHIYLFLRK